MGTVLSSLLPGFREVRAPLIGGYFWLFAGWLALEPWPGREETHGVVSAVADLSASLPDSVVLAAVSLAAYIIGSLAEEITQLGRGLSPTGDPTLYTPSGATWRGHHSMYQLAGEIASDAQRQLRMKNHTLADVPTEVIEEGDGYSLGSGEDDQLWQLREALTRQAMRELPLVRTRLMDDQPALFASSDRHQAEGELRIAVALPLAAIVIILALKTTPLFLGALLVPMALIGQGIMKQRRSRDELIDAMFIGKVRPPVFDRLTRAMEDLDARKPKPAEPPPRRRFWDRASRTQTRQK